MTNDELKILAENMISIMRLIHKKLLKPDIHVPKKGITATHHFIMFLLCETGTQPVSELGKKLHISKPNMTHLISKLCDDGYVQRIHDCKDRRKINISLSEKGKLLLEEHMETIIDSLRIKLSSLSDAEIKSLFNGLQDIKTVVSKMD